MNLLSAIIDDVEKRLPDISAQKKKVKKALSKNGNWRQVEDVERLLFRLKNLSLEKEVARLVEVEKPADIDFNVLERIINVNDLMPVTYLYQGTAAARTVGRINIRSESGSAGYGSGFMVSPQLILTNHHVLENVEMARHSLVEMNYRETEDGISESSFFRLLPDKFFVADDTLDFALVAVELSNHKGDVISNFGFNQMIRDSGKALVGEHVNIIQHPSAEPKQIAIRNNKIIGKSGNFLHYLTDTRRGSSGSPVFNDSWDLVALHHAGKPKRDGQNNILLIDNSVWDGSRFTMDQIWWEANEGVRISKIIKYLDSLVMSMSEPFKRMYQEIFNSQAINSVFITEMDRISTDDNSIITEPDGSISINLRLNMDCNKASNVSNKVLGTSVNQPDSNVITSANVDTNSHNANLARVIITNADNLNPIYYDPQKDEDDRVDYYKNVDFSENSADLFQTMSELLKNTHTNILSYRSARLDHLYPVVDRHEYGKLRNIYSGTPLDPEEIIRLELDILGNYEQEFSSILRSESFNSQAERLEALDALEATLPFNCEHVVPQSWFNKHNPMRADLHHLFACEPGCNSFRSNIPYWQFSPIDEALRSECGRREGRKFEPENGRGAVARATLYFLLRYPQEVGNASREMQADRIQILLDWHHREPVDRYELHRNSTINAVQGNRNPIIDFPDVARQIDFTLGIN